jgi:predicted transcriptional regulator
MANKHTVTIDDEIHQRLKIVSAKTRITASKIVEDSLRVTLPALESEKKETEK